MMRNKPVLADSRRRAQVYLADVVYDVRMPTVPQEFVIYMSAVI